MFIPPSTHGSIFGDIYWRYRKKKCHCCGKTIKDKYNIYGSGRFCSRLCQRIRTPERFLKWQVEMSASMSENE